MVLDSLEQDCLRLDSLSCLELGSLELDSLELGSPELGSLELGSLELDSLELGSLELDSLELEYEAPEALEVVLLGSLVQLLSYCVRRLDTIVQVLGLAGPCLEDSKWKETESLGCSVETWSQRLNKSKLGLVTCNRVRS